MRSFSSQQSPGLLGRLCSRVVEPITSQQGKGGHLISWGICLRSLAALSLERLCLQEDVVQCDRREKCFQAFEFTSQKNPEQLCILL